MLNFLKTLFNKKKDEDKAPVPAPMRKYRATCITGAGYEVTLEVEARSEEEACRKLCGNNYTEGRAYLQTARPEKDFAVSVRGIKRIYCIG